MIGSQDGGWETLIGYQGRGGRRRLAVGQYKLQDPQEQSRQAAGVGKMQIKVVPPSQHGHSDSMMNDLT